MKYVYIVVYIYIYLRLWSNNVNELVSRAVGKNTPETFGKLVFEIPYKSSGYVKTCLIRSK